MKLNISSILLILTLLACAPHHPPAPTAPSPYAAQYNPHPYSNPAPTSPAIITQSAIAQTKSSRNIIASDNSPQTEVKVGLLLPLTGANAKLGQNMLDAAMLGLFDKYALNASSTKITLLPKNTGDSTKGAIKAAQDAIADGAQLLLGPLDGASTTAIKPLARKAGINIISFSNNVAVAGDGAFLLGFMPQEQITHIITHIAKQNKQHVAVLLPSNSGNDDVESTLRKAISLSNIKHSTIVKYESSAEDFALTAKNLQNAIATKQQEGLPPADALLMLEGGERAVQLAAALKVALGAQATAIPLYGIGLLDNQALLGAPELLGVEFASSSARSFQQFAKRFEHEYGYSPSKISSLGYDATAIAAEVMASGGSKQIIDAQGFATPANGLIRFNEDGSNRRNLAVMRIENGIIKEISPVKRTFE